MIKIKNILVLAGGDSTRLWPLERKGLVNFLGKPLIQYVLENLAPYAEKLIVVSNSRDKSSIDMIVSETKKHQSCKFDVFVQNEKMASQAGAILAAENKVDGEILIVNSNDIFNPGIIPDLLKQSRKQNLEFILTAKSVKKYFPVGYLILDKQKLKGIVERPLPEKIPSNYVRLVVDYYQDFEKLIETIKRVNNPGDNAYEEALNIAIGSLRSGFLPYNDYWFTIKYPWHILTMMNYFLKKLGNQEVKLGRNVKIGKNSKIVGPAFIGDNTVIGDFTMVRESHIGSNCTIGGYCEVTRSYLSDNVQLHRNFVGDSVLGPEVSMGAGATTANFRFDKKTVKSTNGKGGVDTNLVKCGAFVGQNARIGVNATILPGIKIGKNTFVGPGEVVDRDLGDNLFVFKNKQVKNTSI